MDSWASVSSGRLRFLGALPGLSAVGSADAGARLKADVVGVSNVRRRLPKMHSDLRKHCFSSYGPSPFGVAFGLGEGRLRAGGDILACPTRRQDDIAGRGVLLDVGRAFVSTASSPTGSPSPPSALKPPSAPKGRPRTSGAETSCSSVPDSSLTYAATAGATTPGGPALVSRSPPRIGCARPTSPASRPTRGFEVRPSGLPLRWQTLFAAACGFLTSEALTCTNAVAGSPHRRP